MAPHLGDSPHVVPQQPDLRRLRHREPETEAGTHAELAELRTRHDRNLRAAINLRNLIMPVDGGRSGGGQERVNLQEDPASPQGQPGWGIVPQQPNLPYLLDRERHTVP